MSGAVSWPLSALLRLAFLHALGRATANNMGLPYGSKPGVDLASSTLAPWASEDTDELAPGRGLLEATNQDR